MQSEKWVVSFTGHRPGKLDRYEMARAIAAVAEFLEQRQKEHPNLHVLVGGARGCDEMARCECVRLNIPYSLVLPHVGYRVYWEEAGLGEDYDVHVASVGRPCGPTKVIFVVPDTQPWSPNHNLARNEYLVRWANEVACIYKGELTDEALKGRGGTKHCIRTALSAGKPIHHIDPRKKSNA
jgi:hypothetical protein